MSNEYPVVVTEEFLIALDCFSWGMFYLNFDHRAAVLASPPWNAFRGTRRALERAFGIQLCATVRP